MLCRKKDLYIAEGEILEDFSDELSEQTEPRGSGVNKLTHWVTSDLLKDWVELPLVTPK